MWAFIRGNPRFVKFWVGMWFSEFGDWVRNMALIYLVMDLSGGSAIAVSINMFCEFAPLVIFGLFIGVLADRWEHKKTMLSAVFIRILLIGLLIAAVALQSLTVVYAVAFLSAIGTVLFRAPSSAFTMRIVKKEDLRMAVNLRQMSYSTMFLIGPPLGTLLYMGIGTAWTLFLILVLFTINFAFIASVTLDKMEKKASSAKGFGGVMAEMNDGFRQAWMNRMVRPLLFSNALFGLSAGLSNVLSIFILTEFLDQPKETYSLFVATQGVGMLVASFVIPKVKLSRPALLTGGMIVMGLCSMGMMSYPHYLVTYSFVVLFAFGMVAFNISMATLLQTTVDMSYQGRVTTTLQTVGTGTMALMMLSAGWLHELLPLQAIILTAGSAMLLGGMLLQMMYSRVKTEAQEKPLPL
ncbi:hypothetical protein CBW65_03500 [Tumebacillus avium]|uniref:Major facilitator superfamily (MFS) profile domain-containing protein n=1 Tax=Tumebacillus avium TaxID=1903704 RepID=A0A1Y0IIE4_9BACL|nr:MFS transporter [Tumebacillus avium]ARU60227.1 hypothetical protein CBW65_03500 [Tumebacillus avium]